MAGLLCIWAVASLYSEKNGCSAGPTAAKLEIAATFQDWIHVAGGNLHPAVRIVAANASDYQIGARVRLRVVTSDVNEGDELIRIPLTRVIWKGTAISQYQPKTARAIFTTVMTGTTVSPGAGPIRPGEPLVPGIDPEDCALALFLLYQAALGPKSQWHAYIQTLPEHMHTIPANFGTEALEALQDPAMAGAARHAHAVRKRAHGQLVHALQRLSTVVRRGAGHKRGRQAGARSVGSFAAFSWALAIIQGRALSLRGAKFLVPGADHIAYEPHPDFRAAAHGSRFLRYHKVVRQQRSALADTAAATVGILAHETGSRTTEHGQPNTAQRPVATEQPEAFVVMADRRMLAGTLVREDYGDAPSYVLFQHHGFIPQFNPFDCVRIKAPNALIQATNGHPTRPNSLAATQQPLLLPEIRRERTQLLMALRVSVASTVCLRPGALPHQLTAALAIVGASDHAISACSKAAQLANSADIDDATVATARSRCVETILQSQLAPAQLCPSQGPGLLGWVNAVVGFLAQDAARQLPTSISDDQALLAAADACTGSLQGMLCVPMRIDERMAVQFRLSRKTMLQRVEEYFTTTSPTFALTNQLAPETRQSLNTPDPTLHKLDVGIAEPDQTTGSSSFINTTAIDARFVPTQFGPIVAWVAQQELKDATCLAQIPLEPAQVARNCAPQYSRGSKWLLPIGLEGGHLMSTHHAVANTDAPCLLRRLGDASVARVGLKARGESNAIANLAAKADEQDAINVATSLCTAHRGGPEGLKARAQLLKRVRLVRTAVARVNSSWWQQLRAPPGRTVNPAYWEAGDRSSSGRLVRAGRSQAQDVRSSNQDFPTLVDLLVALEATVNDAAASDDAIVLLPSWLRTLAQSPVTALFLASQEKLHISIAYEGAFAGASTGVGEELAKHDAGRLIAPDDQVSLGICRTAASFGAQSSRLWQLGIPRHHCLSSWKLNASSPCASRFIAAATGLTIVAEQQLCLDRLRLSVLSAREIIAKPSLEETVARLQLVGFRREVAIVAAQRCAEDADVSGDRGKLPPVAAAETVGDALLCARGEPSGSPSEYGGCGICIQCGFISNPDWGDEEHWMIL